MSYTLNYTGSEIDDILDRAAPGGAIDQALAAKQDTLTFDAVPTQGSTNPAESGGIYDAIQAGGATALAAFATDSVSGDVVSFPDGADNIHVKAFVGSILPAQSGSGDPSPSNIRPISGWTGANITRAGKNLYNDATTSVGSYINSSGVVGTSSGNVFSLSDYIPVTGDKVTITNPGGWGNAPSACFFDKDKNFISGTHPTTNIVTLTIPSGAAYLRTSLSTQTRTSTQVELGSTASPFEPYTADTILLSFGQTVYAGTITALGGGLWQVQPTHAIVDLGTLTYNYRSAKNCFDANVSNMVDGVVGTVADIKCSTYPATTSLTFSSWQNAPDKSIFASTSESSKIVIRDTAYTSAADFVAAVTGQTLLYQLATLPDPIIVTAEDLTTLLGANTVWLNCGSVTELEYRADTALYIQKLLNGGGSLSLSMASPSPSLILGRVGVLAEPEEAEPEQTEEPVEEQETVEEPVEEGESESEE